MKLRIQSINFDATTTLESYINKKISKLDKFFDEIINIEVYLKVVKPETAINKEAEIKIEMKLKQILNIEINSTIIIIGQIVKVHIPEARLAEDGLVKPDDLLLSGGLDAYYSSEFITQLPYAKP